MDDVKQSPGDNGYYWMGLGVAVIIGASFLGAGTNNSGDESNNGLFITIGVVALIVASLGVLMLSRSMDWSEKSSKIGIGAFVLVSVGAVVLSVGEGAVSIIGYAITGAGVGLMVATALTDRKAKQLVA